VHPFAITTGRNDARIPQVCQMSGNLWLRLPENLHEIADTQFLISHQIQESQPGVVPERLKELRHVE
jgi:hypothetical protein